MAATYKIWGEHLIDDQSKAQMDAACSLPVAVSGALMPDAHLGYGLPIGGVLALDNAVCPYAVGVDIACRMKLSIFELPAEWLDTDEPDNALKLGTFFGVGKENTCNHQHSVIDDHFWDWSLPAVIDLKDKARRQLGTSGSGNHFAEFGTLKITDPYGLQIKFPGGLDYLTLPGGSQWIALMTHSGSRGTGAAVCNYYTKIAKEMRPEYGDLAWLDLGTPAGDDYWYGMNLMGAYASANHQLIHDRIEQIIGVERVATIENHHNFAWSEVHGDRRLIVHRKGATPASANELGVIPGSMGTACYVVSGKGNAASLRSASHGAGRQMSRKQAKKTFNLEAELAKLKKKGVRVLSCGADEVCGVYKDIDMVMAQQADLVDIQAKFEPRVVKMSSDGKAED